MVSCFFVVSVFPLSFSYVSSDAMSSNSTLFYISCHKMTIDKIVLLLF